MGPRLIRIEGRAALPAAVIALPYLILLYFTRCAPLPLLLVPLRVAALALLRLTIFMKGLFRLDARVRVEALRLLKRRA